MPLSDKTYHKTRLHYSKRCEIVRLSDRLDSAAPSLIAKSYLDHNLNDDEMRRIIDINNVLKDSNGHYTQTHHQIYSEHDSVIAVSKDFSGQSLSEYALRAPLSSDQKIELALKISFALEEIHKAGIVHNDLTNKNIIIDDSVAGLKLIDFESASINENRPCKNRLFGHPKTKINPRFASPEQISKYEDIDYRTDYYSFGVLFYWLLTDQYPFDHTETLNILHLHKTTPPTPPIQLNPNIPLAASEIAIKLLSKDRANRYDNIGTLQKDLSVCWKNRTNSHSRNSYSGVDIYGESEEYKVLGDQYSSINSRHCTLHIINGSEDSGKTALVNFFLDEIRAQHSAVFHITLSEQDEQYRFFGFKKILSRIIEQYKLNLSDLQTTLLFSNVDSDQLSDSNTTELFNFLGNNDSTSPSNRSQLSVESLVTHANIVSSLLIRQPNPIVIYIENINYLDKETTQLLEEIIRKQATPNTLIIGTANSINLPPAHQLNILSRSLRALIGGHYITTEMKPLSFFSVTQLMATYFTPASFTSSELAHAISQKTSGFPQSVDLLLKRALSEGILQADEDTFEWTWDKQKFDNFEFSGNYENELIEEVYRSFSDGDILVLEIASCFSSEFTAQELLKANNLKDQSSILTFLNKLSSIGIASQITYPNESLYSFRNSHLRDCVYNKVSTENKLEYHRTLTGHFISTLDSRNAPTFYKAAQHANIAFELSETLPSSIEITQTPLYGQFPLARLNAIAGEYSFREALYDRSLDYFQNSLAAVSTINLWHVDYSLAYYINYRISECHLLLNRNKEANRQITAALTRCKSAIDKAKFFELNVRCFKATNRHHAAVTKGIECLALLDINIPQKPSSIEVSISSWKVFLTLLLSTDKGLLDNSVIKNEKGKLVQRVIEAIMPSSFMSNTNLVPYLLFKSLGYSLKHGFTPETSILYIQFAAFLQFLQISNRLTNRFYNLSLKLLKNPDLPYSKSNQIGYFYWSRIGPWQRSAADCVKPLLDIYKRSMYISDLEYASYSSASYFSLSILAGYDSKQLTFEIENALPDIEKLNQGTIVTLHKILWQFLYNITEKKHSQAELNGPIFFQNDYVITPDNKENLTSHMVYYWARLNLDILFGDYHNAYKTYLEGKKIADGLITLLYVTTFDFYGFLAICTKFRNQSLKSRVATYLKLTKLKAQFSLWSKNCPSNFQHRLLVIRAEHSYLLNKNLTWYLRKLEEAIELAEKERFFQDAAIICERINKTRFETDFVNEERINQIHKRAISNYKRYGCSAKVTDLTNNPPFASKRNPLSSVNRNVYIDETQYIPTRILSICLELSQETDISCLIDNLLQEVNINSGAERCVLGVKRGETFSIVAERVESEKHAQHFRTLLDDYDDISRPTILKVIESREMLIIDDASSSSQVSIDPYFSLRKPKSVLVVPLIRKSQVTGFLYLENNRYPAAFTVEKLNLIHFIANQAAISLDNSILLGEKENAVEERVLSEKFQAMMSHELRTSMNGLIHFANDINTYEHDATKRNYYIRRTIETAKEALRISNDILDFELLNQGKFELRPHDFHLSILVDSISHEFKNVALKRHIDLIEPDMSRLPDQLTGDSVRIKQVLRNLISNAIKFTSHGQVALEVELIGSTDTYHQFCFSVEDTGCGISEEFIAELFDAFRREDNSTTRRQNGSGLGLYIVKSLVKLMGGEISVQSQKDQGTRFEFYLDIKRADGKFGFNPAITEDYEYSSTKGLPTFEHLSLLVVDDNATNQEVIVSLLQKLKCHFLVLDNGYDAIDWLKNTKYDLVLMDIEMPGMDGYQTTESIRKFNTDTPIVALTAHAFTNERRKALQQGFNGYLSKPVNVSELCSLISRLTEQASNINFNTNTNIDSDTDTDRLPNVNVQSRSTDSNSMVSSQLQHTIDYKVIDFNFALDTLGWDMGILNNQIIRFIESYQHFDQLITLEQLKNKTKIKQLFHGMKTIAKALGASTLTTLAEEVESNTDILSSDAFRSQIVTAVSDVLDALKQQTSINQKD